MAVRQQQSELLKSFADVQQSMQSQMQKQAELQQQQMQQNNKVVVVVVVQIGKYILNKCVHTLLKVENSNSFNSSFIMAFITQPE